jgi:putative transcriptional regulator
MMENEMGVMKEYMEKQGIRNKAGMTQAVFANYMGVSKKTVEAWELGRTHPTGPAYRLLDILESGKEQELSFISVG